MLVTCSTHPFAVSSFSLSLALFIVFSTHIHTHVDPDYSVQGLRNCLRLIIRQPYLDCTYDRNKNYVYKYI